MAASAPVPTPPPGVTRYEGTASQRVGPYSASQGLLLIDGTYSGSSNFIVSVEDSDGVSDLSVNTIGAYTGVRGHQVGSDFLDLAPGNMFFDVTASGPWRLDVSNPSWTAGSGPPVNSSGSGDTVIGPFSLASDLHLLTATHSGSSNFIVELMKADGADSDLLANEIGSYGGTVPIRVGSGFLVNDPGIYALVVQAEGSWNTSITTPNWNVGPALPFNASGSGPDVVGPFNLTSGTRNVTLTHTGSSNFIVKLISEDGEEQELVANEIGAFSDTVPVTVSTSLFDLPPGAYALAVDADGSWTANIQ